MSKVQRAWSASQRAGEVQYLTHFYRASKWERLSLSLSFPICETDLGKDSIRLYMPVLKVWSLEQPPWWHLGGNLQEMQVLGSHPIPPKLETLGWDPASKPSR